MDSSLVKLESCNLYFMVDIFRNYPLVFRSTPEGFPRKIWCSFVDVCFVVLVGIFCFHNIAIAW